jgi:TPR repeat protein
LGSCYAYGRGVPPNLAAAAHWYQRSAIQGYPPGQYHLGVCYESGSGVAQDYTQAMNWFRQAAARGYAPATSQLSYCEAMSGGQGKKIIQPPPPPTNVVDNALSVDEIKVLSSCGSKPEGIIAQIDETHSRYSQQDIAALQEAKVDPAVINHIKNNGSSSP